MNRRRNQRNSSRNGGVGIPSLMDMSSSSSGGGGKTQGRSGSRGNARGGSGGGGNAQSGGGGGGSQSYSNFGISQGSYGGSQSYGGGGVNAQSGGGGGSQSYSNFGISQGSFGGGFKSQSGGLIGGMTTAEALSKPMGYSFSSSKSTNGDGRYGSSGTNGGGYGSGGTNGGGYGSGGTNSGPGLLGDGLRGNSSVSRFGSKDSGGFGGGGSNRLGASSGSGGGASFGGNLDDFAAKVRLQQQMLADERQKSVQQQIEEQLEKQNRKRLEYNRMKRDKDTNRRDGRGRQSGGGGDRRPRSANQDVQQETGLDDVHVTIRPRSEGRAVSDNTGGRKRNLSDRSRNQTTGPQNAKRSPARDNSNNTAAANSSLPGPFKCHVCIVTCRDMKGYELHMKGRKHIEVMDRMKRVTEYQAQQAIQRLEAEGHLKKLQGHKNKDEDDHYCRDCLTHYSGDLLTHRRTNAHKEARRTRRPHCRVCDVSFKTVKKYVAHCNTPGHKKVYEAAKKKGEQGEEEEDKDFVTVDSVGVFDEEGDNVSDEAMLTANLSPDGKVQDSMQTDLGEGFNQAITVTNVTSEEDDIVVIDSDAEADTVQSTSQQTGNAPAPFESSDTDIFAGSSADSTIDDLVSAQLVSEPESMMTNDCTENDSKTQELAEYDPDVAIGRHLVVPVWGYFCRPCRKFYQSVGSQGAVLDAHCKTREHHDAYMFVQSQPGGPGEAIDDDKNMDYLSLAIAKHYQHSKDSAK